MPSPSGEELVGRRARPQAGRAYSVGESWSVHANAVRAIWAGRETRFWCSGRVARAFARVAVGCPRGSAGHPETNKLEASPHESYPAELMPATLCGGQRAEPIAIRCGPANGFAEQTSGAPPAAEINVVPRSSPGLSRDWCGAAWGGRSESRKHCRRGGRVGR